MQENPSTETPRASKAKKKTTPSPPKRKLFADKEAAEKKEKSQESPSKKTRTQEPEEKESKVKEKKQSLDEPTVNGTRKRRSLRKSPQTQHYSPITDKRTSLPEKTPPGKKARKETSPEARRVSFSPGVDTSKTKSPRTRMTKAEKNKKTQMKKELSEKVKNAWDVEAETRGPEFDALDKDYELSVDNSPDSSKWVEEPVLQTTPRKTPQKKGQ